MIRQAGKLMEGLHRRLNIGGERQILKKTSKNQHHLMNVGNIAGIEDSSIMVSWVV